MSKVYNLAGKDEKITFDFGTYSLDFYSSDKKSKEVSDKAEELKKEADNLENKKQFFATGIKKKKNSLFMVSPIYNPGLTEAS